MYFAKTGFSQKNKKEVRLRGLDYQEVQRFYAAMGIEWQRMLDNECVQVLSPEESQKVFDECPERVMGSRFVHTWKQEDSCAQEAKSRWCVQGYGDPDSVALKGAGETGAPTLSQAGKMHVLSVIAGSKWRLNISDISAAFLQTPELVRERGQVYVRPPSEGLPGISANQIILLKKPVYGLDDAPMKWFRHFTSTVSKIGFTVSKLDPCIFYLRDPAQKLVGIFGLHVDDSVSGGSGAHWDHCWQQLRTILPFRKTREGEGEFVGSELWQRPDYGIEITQKKFSAGVTAIKVPQGVDDSTPAGPGLISQCRGLLGAVTWLASQSRPDLQVCASLGQQRLKGITVGGVKRLNAVVHRIHQHSDMPLVIPSIDPKRWEIAGFSDASHQNASGGGTQAGSLVTLVERGFGTAETVKWGPLLWRSHRLRRVVVSTLSGETMSLIESLGHVEWVVSLILETFVPEFNVAERERFFPRLKSWQVTDAKSVFDHLQMSNPSHGVEDRRTGLDFVVAK